MGHRLTKKLQIKNRNDWLGNGNVSVAKQKVPDTSIVLCIALHIISKNKVTENSRIMGQSGVEKL